MKLFIRCSGVNETLGGVSVTFSRSPSNEQINQGAGVELDSSFAVNFTADQRDLGKGYSVGQDYAMDLGGDAGATADLTAPTPLDPAALEANVAVT